MTKTDMKENSEAFDAPADPYDLFKNWLAEAEKHEINDPNAMCLATATPDGKPSARIMLLKGLDEHGFVFYTNDTSRKGDELKSNSYAAICFHWKTLLKQVRVEGIIEQVSEKEADAYYNTRPRGSRVGAWASKQSQELNSYDELEKLVGHYEEKFKNEEAIPRPPYWNGFRLKPTCFEFWFNGKYRLHQRYLYELDSNGDWVIKMLHP